MSALSSFSIFRRPRPRDVVKALPAQFSIRAAALRAFSRIWPLSMSFPLFAQAYSLTAFAASLFSFMSFESTAISGKKDLTLKYCPTERFQKRPGACEKKLLSRYATASGKMASILSSSSPAFRNPESLSSNTAVSTGEELKSGNQAKPPSLHLHLRIFSQASFQSPCPVRWRTHSTSLRSRRLSDLISVLPLITSSSKSARLLSLAVADSPLKLMNSALSLFSNCALSPPLLSRAEWVSVTSCLSGRTGILTAIPSEADSEMNTALIFRLALPLLNDERLSAAGMFICRSGVWMPIEESSTGKDLDSRAALSPS